MIDDVVIMIPALNPDYKFINFIDLLVNVGGYKEIIVIDDGSNTDSQKYFDIAQKKYNCQIIKHYVNLGQGRAFKSGFNYFLGKYNSNDRIKGIIECDCDGQHILEDVDKCATLLRENPEKLILGVRDFKRKDIPLRSKLGNITTNAVFKFFCGLDVSDTQTGLKGIGKELIKYLIQTPGERFEYASSVLLDTKKRGIEIVQFPINTIYINGNESSHFNPLIDSLRIYSLIFKYLLSSLSAFIIDIITFSISIELLRWNTHYIILSTYIAKIFSCTYSYFINKNVVFHKNGNIKSTIFKWIILCIFQSAVSGMCTTIITNWLGFAEVFCKIIVDIILFFFSFQIQNRWVFKK